MWLTVGFSLAFLLLNDPLPAQIEDETFRGPHIEKLIGEGKYEDAYAFIRAGVEKGNTTQTYSAVYYCGYGSLFIEVGKPQDAGQALKVAEQLSGRSGLNSDFLARAMAGYLLSQGDYAGAASWAVKALRESSYRKLRSVVLAYCRSLEAMARLRSGDLQRAEKLIREALKDVPKNNDSEPLFASRVLFAGCIIESHRANYEEAREFCRRGLEVLQLKKIDSRDVSLAHLAMAESFFLSGDFARSREFAEKSMQHTAGMFQREHQDTVSALEILARVAVRDNKPVEAATHAQAALEMALAVFGDGAGGVKGPKRTLEEVLKAIGK